MKIKSISKTISVLLCAFLFIPSLTACSTKQNGSDTIELPTKQNGSDTIELPTKQNESDTIELPINISMPVLSLNGDMFGISKETEVELDTTYKDNNQEFSMKATLKLQGASSLGYEKKNYTIKFEKKVKIVDSWGKQKKYCLKANYIDYSQARNVVSAKLYGQIVESRNIKDEFSKLVNGGAIDGFPIIITLNGEFLGLYTLNIPKDEWLFDMNDETISQAILMGDSWTREAELRKKINGQFSANIELINGIELEYNSKEKSDEYKWITDSFNSMIDFLQTEQNEESFKANLSNYVNTERAIDSMIFTQFICAADNTSKNILWVTYDGQKWTPSVYDLDGSWGLVWDGESYYSTNYMLDNSSNLLWEKLYQYYKPEIKNRYFELRDTILTLENIANTFIKFDNLIQQEIKEAETKLWKNVPSQDTNNISQIIYFAANRLILFDEYFNKL